MPEVALYDDLAADYDRFVDWEGRLRLEMPFIQAQLQQAGARRVLDAACGTGMHTLALAGLGLDVLGADLSAAMIQRARENVARAHHMGARFLVAGFGELQRAAGSGFDALLCLGNSLPHALRADGLRVTLQDFHACLRPGGLLLVQNRNFDAVLARRERWMEPQSHREGDAEWLFLRFYDYDPDGLLTFNMLTLKRQGAGAWQQAASATRLRPLPRDELMAALETAGFGQVTLYGNLQGAAFDAGASPNLVVVGHK